jgi:hypothetical protein
VSLSTKKTSAWFVYTNSNGYTLVQVGCPKGFGPIGGSKSQVDRTCLEDTEKQFDPGMASPGAISVPLDFDPTKVSHQDIVAMDISDLKTTWIVGMSDGTSPPTVNASTGVITWPSTRTYVEFQGYVADTPVDFQIDKNVGMNVSIQRSGPKIWHYKA